MPSLTRTFEITDVTPQELASMFTSMCGDQQAEFFDAVWDIARKWPGAGWCQQSCDINKHLTRDGKQAVVTLASHVTGTDLIAA